MTHIWLYEFVIFWCKLLWINHVHPVASSVWGVATILVPQCLCTWRWPCISSNLSVTLKHTRKQEYEPLCDCLSQPTSHALHHSAGFRCQNHLGDKESPLPPAGDTSSIYKSFLFFLFCILSIYVKHIMAFVAVAFALLYFWINYSKCPPTQNQKHLFCHKDSRCKFLSSFEDFPPLLSAVSFKCMYEWVS